MRRRDLYQRMTLLERISERTLVEQRAQLQEQRRTANMEASFQRQRLQVRPTPDQKQEHGTAWKQSQTYHSLALPGVEPFKR